MRAISVRACAVNRPFPPRFWMWLNRVQVPTVNNPYRFPGVFCTPLIISRTEQSYSPDFTMSAPVAITFFTSTRTRCSRSSYNSPHPRDCKIARVFSIVCSSVAFRLMSIKIQLPSLSRSLSRQALTYSCLSPIDTVLRSNPALTADWIAP